MIVFQRPRTGIYAVAIAMFSVFAIYNLFLATAGRPSCACFGVVSQSAWHSFGIDIGCLASLVGAWIGFPSTMWERAHLLDNLARRVLAASTGFACACAALFVGVDGLAATARLRGEALRLDASSLDMGSIEKTGLVRCDVQLINKWSEPVTLTGAETNCNCDPLADLPIRLERGERRSIGVSVAVPRRNGRFEVPLTLYTDVPWQPVIKARLRGTVLREALVDLDADRSQSTPSAMAHSKQE